MLEIQNLICGYDETMVINGLSFQLQVGQNLCIIGPNGCGKSTLLRAIAKILPYRGSIKLHGKEVADVKRKELSRRIALMSQTTDSSYFAYTIYETVALGRYAHQNSLFSELASESKDFILACLEKVNLLDCKDKRITELSGGQLQRVFLAKTLAQDPELILLDEPTNHLDIKYQLELLEQLSDWSQVKNRGVVAVLHDLNMVRNFANQVLLMKAGKCVAYGDNDTVFTGEAINKTYDINIKSWMRTALARW